MSHLPREALSYETVVSEYFLGLRGAGLMLSPLDLEQVRDWHRRGLPVAVVCRGLRAGVEDASRERPAGSPAPRALRAYRHAVEREWRAYQHGRVGSAPPPVDDERAAVLRRIDAARALALAAPERAAPGLRGAYDEADRDLAEAAAHPPRDLRAVDDLFAAIDGRLVAAWRGTLERRQRAAIGRRCALVAGPRAAGCTPRAHREALRTHVAEMARRAGLTLLGGSV